MKILSFISYLIVFLGIVNLLRMMIFLIGSDIYGLKKHLAQKKSTQSKKKLYKPLLSVVIPAHNEEKTIIRCLSSVASNNYPQSKLQIIVIDDGSVDHTPNLVRKFKEKNKLLNLQLIRQKNSGKANALNKGIKNYTKGSLVMCLDGDSYLEKNALTYAAQYFEDQKVAALSSNVKIIDDNSLINLIQKFEYLICYQMKRAQTTFNIEYIIGGIGSVFRKSILKKVGFYDHDTVTEDIDLTMKILQKGNKHYRVIYGADVIAYTESCQTIGALIKQRYRWKWGRSQTFFKNKNMFFNSDQKYSRLLTYFYLPFAIFCDFAFFLEPFLAGYILLVILIFKDTFTFISAYTVISAYIGINILAEETLGKKDKIKLLLISPTMYIFFYLLSFVEYVALIKALINLPKLSQSINQKRCFWQHVDRKGISVDFTV